MQPSFTHHATITALFSSTISLYVRDISRYQSFLLSFLASLFCIFFHLHNPLECFSSCFLLGLCGLFEWMHLQPMFYNAGLLLCFFLFSCSCFSSLVFLRLGSLVFHYISLIQAFPSAPKSEGFVHFAFLSILLNGFSLKCWTVNWGLHFWVFLLFFFFGETETLSVAFGSKF